MMDSMGFNDCLLFIQEFGTDCFGLVYIILSNFEVLVLKDDSMEVDYIGSYQMHPDRSSCLGLSANGLMV